LLSTIWETNPRLSAHICGKISSIFNYGNRGPRRALRATGWDLWQFRRLWQSAIILHTATMTIKNLEWWSTLLPWGALHPQLPLATSGNGKVKGLVVHRQGQYGYNSGNWVDGDPEGTAFHYGLDVIGWLGEKGKAFSLDDRVVCCCPLEGVVYWIGKDEHGDQSIIIHHSPTHARRRRFSFFGDLEEVFVKKGQKIAANTPVGRPCKIFGEKRFFHFAMGYEVRVNGKRRDYFVNPGASLPGKVVARATMPKTNLTADQR
jgi:hypothetical protein